MLLCLVKNFFLPKSIFGECGRWGEVECFGNIKSLFVFVFVFVSVFFQKSIRWWCGRWGGAECFWNVQSLFFQQMLPRHCPQSQHCSRDIAVSRDEDGVENILKIWAILAVQTWSGPYAYENVFVKFAKTIWKYGRYRQFRPDDDDCDDIEGW